MIKIVIIISRRFDTGSELVAAEFQENIHIIEGSMSRGFDLAKDYEAKGLMLLLQEVVLSFY